MSKGNFFWLLMLLWLLYRGWWDWPYSDRGLIGNNLLLFIMLVLLGWATFGAPLR